MTSAPSHFGAYSFAMRRPPISLLAVLCVCLLGSDCEFRVSSGSPIRPPPEEGEPPEEPDNGLVVVVRAGELAEQSSGAAPVYTLADVAPAIATSFLPDSGEAMTWSLPEVSGATDRIPDFFPAAELPAEPAAVGLVAISREAPTGPTAAVPEPRGLLLFAAGLALSTLVLRRAPRRLRSMASRSGGSD